MRKLALLSSIASALLLQSMTFAQGTNCSNATQVAGLGTFVYNNTNGGGSNFGANTPCNDYPTGLAHETYLQWTAISSGDYRLEIPNIDNDTRLGLYEGLGCTATCYARGQNEVINSSTIVRVVNLFNVQAGDTYLVQVANTAKQTTSGSGGPGALTVSDHPCSPAVLIDDSLEDNDSCQAAMSIAPGTYMDLVTTSSDTDFYSFVAPAFSESSIALPFTDGTVALRTWDGICVPSNSTQFNLFYENRTFQDEVLTFEIIPITGAQCGMYSMTLDVQEYPCLDTLTSDDVFEDNDTLATATPMVPGTYMSLWTTDEDLDYYSIEVPPGFTLSVQSMEIPETVWFATYDAGGQASGLATGIVKTNFSAQPITVRFRAEPSANAGDGGCAEYSMEILLEQDQCSAFGADPLDSETTGSARGVQLDDGFYPDLSVAELRRDAYLLFLDPGQTIQLDFQLNGMQGSLRASLECTFDVGCFLFPTVFASGMGQQFGLTYTNQDPTPISAILLISYLPAVGGETCARYDLGIMGAGSSTVHPTYSTSDFCQPGSTNSSGRETNLMAYLDKWGTEPEQVLVLTVNSGPPGEFGYLVVGTAQNAIGTSLGNGLLCLSMAAGQSIGRYNQTGGAFNSVGIFDSLGRFDNQVGTSNAENNMGYLVPDMTPWGAPIMNGETLYFQAWHRDGGGTSNLSNGVAVTF